MKSNIMFYFCFGQFLYINQRFCSISINFDLGLNLTSCLDKETISSTIANIEVCLKEVKEWMGRNHLMMNEEKTEFV